MLDGLGKHRKKNSNLQWFSGIFQFPPDKLHCKIPKIHSMIPMYDAQNNIILKLINPLSPGVFPKKAGRTYHGQAKGGKRKFPPSFSLQFWSVLVHISSSTNPITMVLVSLERSRPTPQFEYIHHLSRLKVMMSQAGQMSRSFTGGLGHFGCPWVN